MIDVKNVEVSGFRAALRGMRNPMNSWDKADSMFNDTEVVFGKNDLALAIKLRNAGTDHRKFLRQIFVSMDITAPLYWWKEMDTYKVGTVANSTSTMHKITAKPFTFEDFSYDHCNMQALDCMSGVISTCNKLRDKYLEVTQKASETNNPEQIAVYRKLAKDYWYSLIQILPSSYNQTRTVTLNYENLINIYNARKNHKLEEWKEFCQEIASLPYAKELIIGVPNKEIDIIKLAQKNIAKNVDNNVNSVAEGGTQAPANTNSINNEIQPISLDAEQQEIRENVETSDDEDEGKATSIKTKSLFNNIWNTLGISKVDFSHSNMFVRNLTDNQEKQEETKENCNDEPLKVEKESSKSAQILLSDITPIKIAKKETVSNSKVAELNLKDITPISPKQEKQEEVRYIIQPDNYQEIIDEKIIKASKSSDTIEKVQQAKSQRDSLYKDSSISDKIDEYKESDFDKYHYTPETVIFQDRFFTEIPAQVKRTKKVEPIIIIKETEDEMQR